MLVLFETASGYALFKLLDKGKIKEAIKQGYRYFDTASAYGNEKEVGEGLNEAISEGLVKREELFISTKINGFEIDDPEAALYRSMTNLNLDYIDLYLVHSPIGKVIDGKLVKQTPLYKTWAKLENFVKSGNVKSIGVSNFNLQILLDLTSYAEIMPVTNQIEINPFFSQPELLNFCNKYGIIISGFNCFLKSSDQVPTTEKYDVLLLENKDVLSLSEKYKKTPVQIILNWHMKRNTLPIIKSDDHKRREENLQSLDFILSDEDSLLIDKLNFNHRFYYTKGAPYAGDIEIFA